MYAPLAPRYADLAKEPGPKMLVEGLNLHGLQEVPGAANNPVILELAKEAGLAAVYKHDEVAWCGLYCAVVAKRAGKEAPKDPLWARNWAKFGVPAPVPMLGDILVYKRGTGGHVGIYVGEDKDAFYTLGGNQGDRVSIVRMPRNRLIEARRPIYTKQPDNVRVIQRNATGPLSTNEA